MMDYKELQEDFIGRGEMKGFKFKQLDRSKYAYFYKVNVGYYSKVIQYEVFVKRINRRFHSVIYPNGEAFGIQTVVMWTKNYSAAKNYFDTWSTKCYVELRILIGGIGFHLQMTFLYKTYCYA